MHHIQSNDRIVFLRGRKRVGKTSLLWHLRDYHLDPDLFVPCYIDFQLFGSLTGGRSPWFDIADAAFRDLQKNGRIGDVGPPLRDVFIESPAEQLASFFTRLQTHFAPRRLVFLLDEFSVTMDAYQQGALPGEFFQQWRGILQATSAAIAYIIVVQQHTWESSTQKQPARANRHVWQLLELGYSLLLQPLGDTDICELIRRPTRNFLTFTSAALDHAVQLTGSSPFIGQAFCHALVQHMTNQAHHEVTLDDIDAVASQFMGVDETLFDYALQSPDATTFALCSRLARSVGALNTPATLAALRRAAPNINEATTRHVLQILSEQGVVRQTAPDQWQFASLLFYRWLDANGQIEHAHQSS
jgi:hypothetical protein